MACGECRQRGAGPRVRHDHVGPFQNRGEFFGRHEGVGRDRQVVHGGAARLPDDLNRPTDFAFEMALVTKKGKQTVDQVDGTGIRPPCRR